METKIYIKELPCYQKKGNASEKKLRVMERHFYNLGLLATEGQQKEMEGEEFAGGGWNCIVFASGDPFLRAGG